jgi:hypothetical protein
MKFKCSTCGLEHEGWPSIAFDSPYFYLTLSEADKKEKAELKGDFCIIRHDDQTDHFIRVVLNQKVNDEHSQDLQYGVWVSLSEKSYRDYLSNYKLDDEGKIYFGFLCNNIPDYETTLSVKTNVKVGRGGNRPEIFPHDDQMEIDFVSDFFNGITRDVAQGRVDRVLGH